MKAFGAEYRPLDERLEQIQSQMPELQGEIDYLKIKYLSSGEIISEAKDLYSKWNDLLFEEKRRIIENITEKLIIGKDDISINLAYIPSVPELTTERQRNMAAKVGNRPFARGPSSPASWF